MITLICGDYSEALKHYKEGLAILDHSTMTEMEAHHAASELFEKISSAGVDFRFFTNVRLYLLTIKLLINSGLCPCTAFRIVYFNPHGEIADVTLDSRGMLSNPSLPIEQDHVEMCRRLLTSRRHNN